MKFRNHYRLILATIVVLSLLSVFAASAAPRSPFKGSWRAIDLPQDSSNLKMTIAGGGRGVYRLTWRDDYWTFCNGTPGIGRGVGYLDSSDPYIMHTDFVITCFKLHTSMTYQYDAVYDPATDTMVFQDVVWWRAGH
jgi:hypothetical protein